MESQASALALAFLFTAILEMLENARCNHAFSSRLGLNRQFI
ncbi:hypothetical protein PALB_32130 [Pseudoalteromonas luteoviolacea B = ATCC 29581]|nr:hypothetical protein PALB_32130 [Pseudoalteromonas luteoviolacea B = ATCC 29581]